MVLNVNTNLRKPFFTFSTLPKLNVAVNSVPDGRFPSGLNFSVFWSSSTNSPFTEGEIFIRSFSRYSLKSIFSIVLLNSLICTSEVLEIIPEVYAEIYLPNSGFEVVFSATSEQFVVNSSVAAKKNDRNRIKMGLFIDFMLKFKTIGTL